MATASSVVPGIARRVRAARASAGLSTVALARACGLHRAYVSELERGCVGDLRVGTLVRLADELGVRREWLLAGTGARAGEARS